MGYEEILEVLKQKRERLDAAIQALEVLGRGDVPRRGRPPAWLIKRASSGRDTAAQDPVPPKRGMSEAAKKRIGEATRKRWAAKRAAEAEPAPVKRGRPRTRTADTAE